MTSPYYDISNVVKHEYGADYAYCRQLVTVNDTAGTLAIGTVLGQVTVANLVRDTFLRPLLRRRRVIERLRP